jgi:serine/threonine-protein kinase RsbW
VSHAARAALGMDCPAVHDNLAALVDFARRAAAAAGLDAREEGDLRLAVEEACANVIAHGYPPGEAGSIRLSIRSTPERFTVEICDDAPPFDPDAVAAPDLHGDADARAIGGLGLHLMRQVMDEVIHEHPAGGGNRLTLVKHLKRTGGKADGNQYQGGR